MALKIGIGGNSGRGGGGASSADAVSYNNSTSGLQSTNVQGAIDEVGANLGEYVIKNLTIAPTDTTFTNFVVIDQQQIQDIIQTRASGKKFVVIIQMWYNAGGTTTQQIIPSIQGDSGDGLSYAALSEFDLGERLSQYGMKMFFVIIIRYATGEVIFDSHPLRLMLTQEQYDAMPYHYPNCEYLIM